MVPLYFPALLSFAGLIITVGLGCVFYPIG